MKCPALIALRKVLLAGENAHACNQAILVAMVEAGRSALHEYTGLISELIGGLCGCKLVCHNPLVGFLIPVRIVFPSKLIPAVAALSVAIHPESQSCPMDMSELGLNPGTMCACNASGGKLLLPTGSLDICVDINVDPSGKAMLIGFEA